METTSNKSERPAGFAPTGGYVVARMLELRNALGMTQHEFAAALMLNRSTLVNYELGRSEWREIYVAHARQMLREALQAQHEKRMATLDQWNPHTEEVSEPGAGRAANATGAQPPGSLH